LQFEFEKFQTLGVDKRIFPIRLINQRERKATGKSFPVAFLIGFLR